MAIPGDATHAIQWIAFQYRRLNREADTAIRILDDREMYESALLTAGEYVKSLPVLVRGLLDNSAASTHALDALQTMSDRASLYLESRNFLGLSSFLDLQGSGPGDPNILEQLVAQQSEGL